MKRFLSSAILLTICSFARAQSGIDLHNMKTGDEGYMNVFVPRSGFKTSVDVTS